MPNEKEPEKRAAAMPAEFFPAILDAGSGEKLPTEQLKFLVAWASRYGLDAWLGHVIFYFGKPYVTIAGRLYNAHRSGRYRGYTTWPLSPEEKKSWGFNPDDYAFGCAIHLTEPHEKVVAVGRVTQAEVEAMSARDPTKFRSPVVAANPSLMAEKRALARALERAFPLGLPVVEEEEVRK